MAFALLSVSDVLHALCARRAMIARRSSSGLAASIMVAAFISIIRITIGDLSMSEVITILIQSFLIA
uniref:hypothetical protein n=1 Tax=Salmonella sp. TaxID=599 RepID=UPI001CD9ECF2|nr:hypothetical protein [Salmonella sp.]